MRVDHGRSGSWAESRQPTYTPDTGESACLVDLTPTLPAVPGGVQGRPQTSETLTPQGFPDLGGRLRTTANGANGCPGGTGPLPAANGL